MYYLSQLFSTRSLIFHPRGLQLVFPTRDLRFRTKTCCLSTIKNYFPRLAKKRRPLITDLYYRFHEGLARPPNHRSLLMLHLAIRLLVEYPNAILKGYLYPFFVTGREHFQHRLLSYQDEHPRIFFSTSILPPYQYH